MYEITSLDDIYGNSITLYSIKKLLEQKSFPKLSIFSGVMGVGKSSAAKIVAATLNDSEVPVKTYNCGILENIDVLKDEVFSMNPATKRAFIFEEFHSIKREHQESLLQLFDSQPTNVYIICTTTELSKIIRTVRSRAQVWDFKLLSEKQLEQLLDDYLQKSGVVMPNDVKQAVLRSSKGCPRDLIKHTDFALAGDFSAIQLDELLGNINDGVLLTIFSSLKSTPSDFVLVLDQLQDSTASEKIKNMHDFWLRFLMERSGAVRQTLSKAALSTLKSLFSDEEIQKITKVLLRATEDTLFLELLQLNMLLTHSTQSSVVGMQKETMRTNSAPRHPRVHNSGAQESIRLTSESIKKLDL